MNKPHKHAELIIAWANGAEIEYLNGKGEWTLVFSPFWEEDREYRIKPEPPKPWVPLEGKYLVNTAGIVTVGGVFSRQQIEFGVTRTTEALAERAAGNMRAHNRLLAYRDEFCLEYEPVFNDQTYHYFITFDTVLRQFRCNGSSSVISMGTVYFPEDVARELVRKLNAGEVVL